LIFEDDNVLVKIKNLVTFRCRFSLYLLENRKQPGCFYKCKSDSGV